MLLVNSHSHAHGSLGYSDLLLIYGEEHYNVHRAIVATGPRASVHLAVVLGGAGRAMREAQEGEIDLTGLLPGSWLPTRTNMLDHTDNTPTADVHTESCTPEILVTALAFMYTL